jgi:WhiB family transcriptional regulator, redox-sensing transcriptional regulator
LRTFHRIWPLSMAHSCRGWQLRRTMPRGRVGSDTAAGGCGRHGLGRYTMRGTDAMAAGLPGREPRAGRGNGGPALRAGVAGQRLPCGVAPELFFADDPGSIALARRMCASCRARSTCLDGALQRGEPWGVWGGELLQNGVIIDAKRRPGRPRKSVIAA